MSCRATQQKQPMPSLIPTVQLDVVATEAAVAEQVSFDPSRRQLLLATGAISLVSLVGFLLWFNI